MTSDYLKKVCDSFLRRTHVYENCKVIDEYEEMLDHIHGNIFEIVRELREQDFELYHTLWDSTKASQREVLENYLNLEYGEQEVLQEEGILGAMFLWTVYGLFGAWAGSMLSMKFQKKVAEFHKIYSNILESIGETIRRKGRYEKFRYAIVFKNAQQCYKEAGISDLSDISKTTWLHKNLKSNKGRKQTAKLQECFVDFYIHNVVLLSRSYFMCLKTSGQFENVAALRPDEIMNALKTLNTSAACTNLYNELQRALTSYTDLLDFIYDDEHDKVEKREQLKSSLFDEKNKVRNIKPDTQQNKQQQNKNQPQKRRR